jgi:hypothetical protein
MEVDAVFIKVLSWQMPDGNAETCELHVHY